MQTDTLVPVAPQTLVSLREACEGVLKLCAQEMTEYQIDEDSRLAYPLEPSFEIGRAYNLLLTGLAQLPADAFDFICYGSRLSDIDIEEAQAGTPPPMCLTMMPRKVRSMRDAVTFIQTEDAEIRTSRHFYVAAMDYSHKATSAAMRDEDIGVRAEIEAMGLTFNPFTPEEAIALSDSKAKLNRLFSQLSGFEKEALQAALAAESPNLTLDTLMRRINGNDPAGACESSGPLAQAAKWRWPDFRGPGIVTFNSSPA